VSVSKLEKPALNNNVSTESFPEFRHNETEEVVDDLKHADKTEAHAEAEQAGWRRDEGQGCDALLPADLRVERVPDEHLEDQGPMLYKTFFLRNLRIFVTS